MSQDYNKKYLKYKNKYLLLKELETKQNMKGGMMEPTDQMDTSDDHNMSNLDTLPIEVVERILPSLSIKNITKLAQTNKRYQQICDNYIRRYIRDKKYINNIEDIFVLLNHPLYGRLVKPDFYKLSNITKMELLNSRLRNIIQVFNNAVRQNGGPSSPNVIFRNGGRVYRIDIIYDIMPGNQNILSMISAFSRSAVSESAERNAPGFFGYTTVNGYSISTNSNKNIYNSFIQTLPNTTLRLLDGEHGDVNVRVVELVYDPGTFGTNLAYPNQEPRETNVLYSLFN